MSGQDAITPDKALVVIEGELVEFKITDYVDLNTTGADFSRVRNFEVWEQCARLIVDYGRAAGFWLLDTVEYVKNNFGYSSTGWLTFLGDVEPRLRPGYPAPTDEDVAGWLGKKAKTVQNLRQIAKLIADRTLLEGVQVSVWDFQEVLIDGLEEEDRLRLARNHVKAIKSGGYTAENTEGSNTSLIHANRSELRRRAINTRKLSNVEDTPQGKGKTLERHTLYPTVPVWRLRKALEILKQPTHWLPSETTHDDQGALIQRFVAMELGASWLQEVKPDEKAEGGT